MTVGTYADLSAAESAMAAAMTDIARGDWIDPSLGKITFAQLAEQVAKQRKGELAPRTIRENGYLLNNLVTAFGDLPVNKIRCATSTAGGRTTPRTPSDVGTPNTCRPTL